MSILTTHGVGTLDSTGGRGGLGIGLVSIALVFVACGGANSDLVSYDIDYWAPEASDVELVWGVGGWGVLADSLRPRGTTVVNSVMRTSMTRRADHFLATIRAPAGLSIEHGFLITQASRRLLSGPVWDGSQPPMPRPDRCCSVRHQTAVSDSARLALSAAGAPLALQTIRYEAPEADSVVLVWGIDGWQQLPEALRPPATTIANSVMHTAMADDGMTFVTSFLAPVDSHIDYGFLIVRLADGSDAGPFWEGGDGLNALISPRPEITVEGTLSLPELPGRVASSIGPASHEIQYQLAGAGRVYLVWGVDDWNLVPESDRPPGTEVWDDGLMHTVMEKAGDVFVSTIRVPRAARVDYGFLVTHSAGEEEIHPLWDDDSVSPLPRDGGVTLAESTIDMSEAVLR